MSFVVEMGYLYYGLEASFIWPKSILRYNKLELFFNCTQRNVGEKVPPLSKSKRKFGESNLLNFFWKNTHPKRYVFFHVLPSLRDVLCSNTTVIRSSVVACIFAQERTTGTYFVPGICFELFINGVSS